MFAGALDTFGQPFVDMIGVFRCTEHFYARIIAQDPIPDSHKNRFSAAPVSNRKTAVWYRSYLPVPQCLNAYNLQTMSFLADICKCAREQARLGLDSMAVAVPGGGGGIRAMPPKGQSPGTNISFAPQTEAGPAGSAWAHS